MILKKNWQKIIIILLPIIFILGYFWNLLPDPLFPQSSSPLVLDQEGEVLCALTSEEGQWYFPSQTAIPYKFEQALLEFEDRNFYFHPGVDPGAILRALGSNLQGGAGRSGASTLTMQVVRLSMSGSPRTWGQKLLESFLALRLELTQGKTRILQLFADHAPFGGNVVGLEAASRLYFRRTAGELSWAEAALLAVLPNAPSLIRPGKNQALLLAKRNRLLDRLEARGKIKAQEADLAKEEPLPEKLNTLPRLAQQILTLNQGVKPPVGKPTTLDGFMETRVQNLVDLYLSTLQGNRIFNAAVLVMETQTGKVKAYVANRSPDSRPQMASAVDLIQARRSTGSVLKPLLYGHMLEEGELLPTQLVPDIPTRLGDFHPENFSRGYDGMVPASAALARSLNIPAVRELYQYGIPKFYARLQEAGLTTINKGADHYGLSLIIGGAEGSLWELTGLYGSLGRAASGQGGVFPPTLDPSRSLSKGPGVLTRESAWLTLEALTTLTRPGEEGPWETYSSSRKIAWKTGTSQGFRDAWSLGVTPEYTVGVWVGNASGEGRPDLTGARAAAPLLFQVFGILPGKAWFDKPWGGLKSQSICLDSGYPAGPNCPRVGETEVPRSAPLGTLCPYCRLIHLDKTEKFQVTSDDFLPQEMVHKPWFVLPPGPESFYRKTHPNYKILPASLAPDRGNGGRAFSLIFPEEGTRLYLPVELDGTLGQTVFQAAHRRRGSRLFWHLDGAYLGTTTDLHQFNLRPTTGTHSLTLTDETGDSITRNFTVVSP